MKKTMSLAVLGLALASFAPVQAQDPRDPMEADPNAVEAPSGDRHIRREVSRLARELNLTPEQQGGVRAALEKKREGRRGPLAAETRREIMDVLNPEQKAKFDQMRDERYRPGGLDVPADTGTPTEPVPNEPGGADTVPPADMPPDVAPEPGLDTSPDAGPIEP
jgi:Spy/CpxP family protein refolding chaperone